MSDRLSQMYLARHVQYQLFLSDINEIWITPKDFRKTLKH
jgi:hypothetical protein